MKSLRVALAFLTRIPVGHACFDAADVGRATGVFPLVGGAIGLVAGLAGVLARWAVPDAPLIWGIAAATTVVLLTGGLHQDALADMADGFGGGRTREDVLRIMRDSVVGAYGGIALVLGLGLRVACVAALLGHAGGVAWMVAASALARFGSTFIGWRLPYARSAPGMGRAVTDHVGLREVALAGVLAAGVGFACVGTAVLPALGLALLVAWRVGARSNKRIGGMTGDTLGAVTELSELAILVLGVARGAP